MQTPTSTIWRNPYNVEENQYFDELTKIDCTNDPGVTLQAPAEEQDINVIMKRFGVKDGSKLPYWTDPTAVFGDFSYMPEDPVEAAEMLRQGEVAFMTLPADVRRQFDSGAHLYNWLQDEKNAEEAVRLGLLKKKTPPAPPKPTEVVVVSSSTSSDKGPLVPNTPEPSKGDK